MPQNDLMTLARTLRRVVGFKEDLAPQMIVLAGLPASGKSTFINTELTKYFPGIPHVSGFKTLSSDAQLMKMQYLRAKSDYEHLKSSKDENEYRERVADMTYHNNDKKLVSLPFSYDEFKKFPNLGNFYKKAYKPYYATYFGERAQASKDTAELKDHKFEGSNVVIVDTTGQNIPKNLKYMIEGKERGFTTSIVFLEIDVEYSVARDKYRGETQGRSVGESVIRSIDSELSGAFRKYRSSKYVDRALYFVWQGELIKGKYVKKMDIKKYASDKPNKSERRAA